MKQTGQSLIELLMAMALCAILIPALLTAIVSTREGRAQQEQRTQAISILRGDYEAVRSFKEKDWTNFAKNGLFHPEVVDNSWVLTEGMTETDGFNRSILISDVSRDASGKIVTTGGVVDPSTKKAVITVSWGTPRLSSIDLPVYFTRYKSLLYKETLEEEFNEGTKTKVTVTKTDDGEVVLGSGGAGDWCSPNLTIAGVDLPQSGIADSITAIPGTVFTGTGQNASGLSFVNVSISDESVPSGTIAGFFNGHKTNDVFGESDYAYIATDTNSREAVIIDLLHKDLEGKYLEAGYFNPSPNKNGNGIYVSENVGFLTEENILYTFDLSQKTGERNKLGEVGLDGRGFAVKVVGNYAFVVTDSNSKQLDIVEIKNGGRDLSIIGWAKLDGLGGKDVAVNDSGTKAYVVTERSSEAGKYEFFVVDVTTKEGEKTAAGKYDTGELNPESVALATNNKAIVVGYGGENYQVIDISSDSSPFRCGGITVGAGINSVATVVEPDGDAYSYIATLDASAELKIIAGGPGGKFASSGIFESRTFEATMSATAAFNKFEATTVKPSSTDLTFQIAVAVAGDCETADYVFVGPDGTENTFFTTADAIPFNSDGAGFENPGNCFKYRAYLYTNDRNQTPVFKDITINYSP